MFIGHFALSFAAKRAVPRVGLGTLFAAAAFADVLWPVFLAVGVWICATTTRPRDKVGRWAIGHRVPLSA